MGFRSLGFRVEGSGFRVGVRFFFPVVPTVFGQETVGNWVAVKIMVPFFGYPKN